MLALDFDFGTVWEFLFNEQIVKGAWRTIQVAVIAQVIGIALGIVFALMRVAKNPFAQVTAGLYVWLFRATPVLLQLFILYYGIPQLVDNREFTRELTAFRAAIIAFGINEGAYMTEIIRAGILSVESGQMDAGQSLGMTRLQTMRRIILPQAVRVVVPADRQRVHRDAQEHLDRLRRSASSSSCTRQASSTPPTSRSWSCSSSRRSGTWRWSPCSASARPNSSAGSRSASATGRRHSSRGRCRSPGAAGVRD